MLKYLFILLCIFILVFIVFTYLLKQKKSIENFANNNDKYFKDILNIKERKDLDIILKEILLHLKKKNIDYFFCFGSLLGAVRHGFRMPWDDDIDMLVNTKDINKLLKDLKIKKVLKNETHYYLNKKIIIIHKNWGCPIKIMLNSQNFPFIDIFTFDINGNNIEINETQLIYGHTKIFKEKYTDIFPLKKAKFNDFIINIPRNYKNVLKNLFGDNSLDSCVITWNHKMSEKEKKTFGKKIIKMSDVNKKYIKPHIFENFENNLK